MLQKKSFFNRISKKNAKLRLFCFPYAGGNGSTYSSWVDVLPDDVEVFTIELPGRSYRFTEPAYRDMQNLVEDLMQSFPSLTNKPYILIGHSLGSRVAFELMYRCKQAGIKGPEHFIASGSPAPHINEDKKGIYKLPKEEFIEELRKLNGTPEEILKNDELMALSMPSIRADFELSETYTYTGSEKFDCPITVFYGDEDKEISLQKIEAWEDIFTRPISIHSIPGGHFFIEDNATFVLEKIQPIISNVLDGLEIKNV
ncbi:thioesterase II family protein [Marinicella sp. W31]|uniref:thioesterase II family protein n=1 Tax=Marinicella sp. W31 TaxID=3023713 RepID=UPI0037569FD4